MKGPESQFVGNFEEFNQASDVYFVLEYSLWLLYQSGISRAGAEVKEMEEVDDFQVAGLSTWVASGIIYWYWEHKKKGKCWVQFGICWVYEDYVHQSRYFNGWLDPWVWTSG